LEGLLGIVSLEMTMKRVTGQLADTPTRRLPTRGLDNSRSEMPPKERKLSTQSRQWHPRVVQSATCPVRELSSPRVDQSARCPVSESFSPRVGNPRVGVSASCPVTMKSVGAYDPPLRTGGFPLDSAKDAGGAL